MIKKSLKSKKKERNGKKMMKNEMSVIKLKAVCWYLEIDGFFVKILR